MANKPENPSAFPFQGNDGCGGMMQPEFGMTLRDWFAGQALAGFMANTKRPTTIAEDDATWCYQIADAMLAARTTPLSGES
jgi:hypothetical protein